jgi:hypothetical protein
MNWITFRKGFLSFSLCFITVLSLVSCASQTNHRTIAKEKADSITKNASEAPHKFHGGRFERNNQY